MDSGNDVLNKENNEAINWAEAHNGLSDDQWLDEVRTWDPQYIENYYYVMREWSGEQSIGAVFTPKSLIDLKNVFLGDSDCLIRIIGSSLLDKQSLANLLAALNTRAHEITIDNESSPEQ